MGSAASCSDAFAPAAKATLAAPSGIRIATSVTRPGAAAAIAARAPNAIAAAIRYEPETLRREPVTSDPTSEPAAIATASVV